MSLPEGILYNMRIKFNTIHNFTIVLLLGAVFAFSTSCKKKEGCTDPTATNYDVEAEKDDGSCTYSNNGTTSGGPTPYSLAVPPLFQQYLLPPNIPSNNPMTVEGVELGRKLFYDPVLSADGTQACADCHAPEFAFTDSARFSIGIDGFAGNRNSMPIFNIAWNNVNEFFWDGRALGVEGQAFGPVVNPIEMHNTWPNAVDSVLAKGIYATLFADAFGTCTIDSTHVVKALAQFERTLISGNSRFDQYLMGQIALTPNEINGFNIFMDEARGDCFHCHGDATNPLWTDNIYHNNGLDATFADNGLGDVTNDPNDNGKFKTPSLRNLVFTAPYMHDGRFNTIDEVIEHYSTGLVASPTIDPLMKKVSQGGAQLTPGDKADLKAFLLALTDSSFINNPNFQSP